MFFLQGVGVLLAKYSPMPLEIMLYHVGGEEKELPGTTSSEMFYITPDQ